MIDEANLALPVFLIFVLSIVLIVCLFDMSEKKGKINLLQQTNQALMQRAEKTTREYEATLKSYLDAKADISEKTERINLLQQTNQELMQRAEKRAQKYKTILKAYLEAKTNGTLSYPLEREIEKLYSNNVDNKNPKAYVSSLMADLLTIDIEKAAYRLEQSSHMDECKRAPTIREMKEKASSIIRQALMDKYRFEESFVKGCLTSHSNLQLIPYMSQIYADFCTADFNTIIQWLSFYDSSGDLKKAASITALKKSASDRIEQLKWSEYQLNYLLSLYPSLQDVIETDSAELELSLDDVQNYDPVRKYLSSEEWKMLSSADRNQLALDRYVESHRKSKWQIGRDYELFIGHIYRTKGCTVDFYGSYMGLEDLGRDLICKKGNKTLIVQCKYWSKEKRIHEKHIMQLYGSLTQYILENDGCKASGVLVTNTRLSDVAKKFADILSISFIENIDLGDFPRIKCNIGHDENGHPSKIYHLPMDQQYDKTKIDQPGEMFAFSVAEAEKNGFRRAYKWHSKTEV